MNPTGRILGLLAATMACACVGTAPDPVDVDAGLDPDAEVVPATDARLAFEFGTSPGVPGAFPGPFEPTVTEIWFRLQDVRAIGDAATGSTDTRAEAFELRWHDGDDMPLLEFGAAPPGMYGALLARVREFEIAGTVVIDGVVERFEIEDDELSANLDIALGLQLAADEARVVYVTFDGADLLGDIDWASVPSEEGKRIIDDDHPAIDDIRYRALAAFSADVGSDGDGDD